MNWAALWAHVDDALKLIIAALAAVVVERINRMNKAIERREVREASFDSALTTELESRKTPMTPEQKLDRAVQLANDATPPSIKVQPKDVEAALPRVRASLPAESVLESIKPGEPIPVTVVSSIPAESAQSDATPTLPRPAPLPRDTSREKAPLR